MAVKPKQFHFRDCLSLASVKLGGGFKVTPGAHPKRDHASLIIGLGLSKLQMLAVMGPLEKGEHVGKWGKITMEDCTSFEIGAVDSDGNPSDTEPHSPHYSSMSTARLV